MRRTRDARLAARVLAEGGLVAIPTETVYGLAADATDETALRRVFEVKGRPIGHPLIVHVDSVQMLHPYVTSLPENAQRLVQRFWPGALTIVLRRSPLVPDLVTGGRDTVALRCPDQPLARETIRILGHPVAAPSANRFGSVSPTTPEDVEESLGDDVDLILDGGSCRIGVESTIVDLTPTEPVLLRPGAISRAELEEVLGCRVAPPSGEPRAPGMLAHHYAPEAEVVTVERADADRVVGDRATEKADVAVLCMRDVRLPPGVRRLDAGEDTATYARRLYALLREADRRGVALVVAVLPPDIGIGSAVRDRLVRAASSHT